MGSEMCIRDRCTSVTRTSTSSPCVHAIACSSPSMMRAPTVGFFFAGVRSRFVGRFVFAFVFSVSSYLSAGYPATSIGTSRFIALRSVW